MPIVKKSTSRASRSAVSAADGTSIITPTGTVRHDDARARERRLGVARSARARRAPPRRSRRTGTGSRSVPCARRAQQRAQLRAEQVGLAQAQAEAAQAERAAPPIQVGAARGRVAVRRAVLVDVERADRDRPRRHRPRAAGGRPRTARSSSTCSSGSPPSRNSERKSPMPSAPVAPRHRQVVGELDVGLERMRTPSAVTAGPGRARPSSAGAAAGRRCASRARAMTASGRDRRSARRVVAVDDHDRAGRACARSRRAGRRPPALRASARESRCGRCGCRRRSRSRGPASSRPARRSTASARRRSRTNGPSTCCEQVARPRALRAGSCAAGRRRRRRRPCARAGTGRRSRRRPARPRRTPAGPPTRR